MSHRKSIAILLALILFASLIACGTTATTGTVSGNTPTTTGSTSTPTSVIAKVGQTITLDDVATTLVSVKKLAGDEFTRPKAGNIYVIVHVKIKNKSSIEVSYNPFDFHVRSSSGNITDVDYAVPSTYTANNQLDSGKLSTGGSVEGDMMFQVKKGDHGAQMTWQPSFFGNAGDNAWNLGL